MIKCINYKNTSSGSGVQDNANHIFRTTFSNVGCWLYYLTMQIIH